MPYDQGMDLVQTQPMLQWNIGCSGYHYPEWKGMFYPQGLAKSKWFDYYCQHFKTIELNTTFYKFPRIEFLQSWYNQCPNDFTFSVKAPRLITHFKRMKDSQKYLDDFYHNVGNGLLEKAGAVLFQFPANLKFDEEYLDRIVQVLHPGFNNIVEFRHPSWWNEKVFASFTQHNITFCSMSHPELPDEVIRTTETIYYRFHGVPHVYLSKYEIKMLEGIARQVQQQESITKAFIYFNNTAEGAAIANAKAFQEICELVH